MGAEFTDPLKNCCCAKPSFTEAPTIGSNTSYQFDEYMQSNSLWIIRIQAVWRGKVARMRYYKRRDERRKKSTHFLTQDQLETINRRRVIELRLLFDMNEAELES